MKRVVLMVLIIGSSFPLFASANLAPSQFTITPGMTKEQQLVILRAHVEYLQQMLVRLQVGAASTTYTVTVDYPSQQMFVRFGASNEVFLTVPGVATTTVAKDIARVRGERESVVRQQLSFVYQGADTITVYRVKIASPYSITLERVQANGVIKSERVPRESINGLIAGNFFGNQRIYEQVLGTYVTDLRRNRVAPEIRGIAASLFGVTEAELSDKLQFDVKGYKR